MDAVLARSVTCRRRLGHDKMQLAGQRLVTSTGHHFVAYLVHTGALLAGFTASLAFKPAWSNTGSSQAVVCQLSCWWRIRARPPVASGHRPPAVKPLTSIPCLPDLVLP